MFNIALGFPFALNQWERLVKSKTKAILITFDIWLNLLLIWLLLALECVSSGWKQLAKGGFVWFSNWHRGIFTCYLWTPLPFTYFINTFELNIWFQEISMPTLRKVIWNFHREGHFKSEINVYKRKHIMKLTWIFQTGWEEMGKRGLNQKKNVGGIWITYIK